MVTKYIKKERNKTMKEEQVTKTPEKWEEYYNETIFEDQEEIELIGNTCNAILEERFSIVLKDPRLTTAMFLKTFESFVKKLKSFEKDYDNFQIDLADRLIIGFDNNDNEDDEKSGNFMFFMKHMKESAKTEDIDVSGKSNIEKAVEWNADNIRVQPELIRQMTIDAIKELKSIEIHLANNEIIMPIFITYYETIINMMKLLRRERNEMDIEVNYVWFRVFVTESEDGKDTVYLKPHIEGKLTIKDDAAASSKNE